jgi:hypothetical protein
MRAHVRTRMRITATPTHMDTHMCPVVHVWSVRAHDPPDPRVGASAGPCLGAAAAALTVQSGSASPPPPAAPRARCRTRPCAPTVQPRRAARAHRERAPVGRARQPCARGARPAPTTGNAAAAASNAARRGGTANAQNGNGAQGLQELALAERLGERPHLRAEDGPAVHRAVRAAPRPPRTNGRTWGRTGPKPWKGDHACTHTHAHARDRPTGAFGAATVLGRCSPTRAHPRAHPPHPHARTRASTSLRSTCI